jgi:hypothetical protein
MKPRCPVIQRLAILCCLLLARFSEAEQNNAAKALEQLKSLAGDWAGAAEWTGARTGTYPINAAYYVTGNGSALVENLISEGVPNMTSVYHLDAADLRVTHFCGAENQPRLKAERIDLTQGMIDFGFVDITNLRLPDAPHVHGLEIRFIDSNHVTLTFLFQSGGKESRERISLQRVEKKPVRKGTDDNGRSDLSPVDRHEIEIAPGSGESKCIRATHLMLALNSQRLNL